MHGMNGPLPSDLNLLLVLEALLAERHVSRAAMRLNRSQPAVSHALARLRDIFGDPLLVRGEGGLQPTARALQLAGPLAEALALVRSMVDPPTFDIGQCSRHFRLSLSDYGTAILLPPLVARLRKAAPLIDLSVVSYGRDRALAALIDGEIDLAVGVYPELAAAGRRDLMSDLLFRETFACLSDGAVQPGALSIERYLARPHVRVTVALEDDSEVDAALARLGHKRRIAIQIPHWSAAPDLVRGTDLVLTAAKRSLEALETGSLRCSEPPFRLAGFPFVQTWHRRREKDAPHRWLREEIALAARGSTGEREPRRS
ncbi:LysR family transcriptional regulator [Azospirillum picis]|uniref:DNA-binding transcriptional LysR family regulator n=2 Tax=Azospirillum picis TaxID=488438 RepID=A0ABU0MDX6_9PROT|nr:LysR family transcriptional regulator [Azospirillum picis]MBP2297338.1 DNA-binding transcriptional LysR family regulator [Azospirillum picis]MDQ0531639.1 DNA-binding transcriptional LysR family regulator [Azospirillum picis]